MTFSSCSARCPRTLRWQKPGQGHGDTALVPSSPAKFPSAPLPHWTFSFLGVPPLLSCHDVSAPHGLGFDPHGHPRHGAQHTFRTSPHAGRGARCPLGWAETKRYTSREFPAFPESHLQLFFLINTMFTHKVVQHKLSIPHDLMQGSTRQKSRVKTTLFWTKSS